VSYVIKLAPGFSKDKTLFDTGIEILKETLKPFNANIDSIFEHAIVLKVRIKFARQMIEQVTKLDFCHWIEVFFFNFIFNFISK
jgi:hypothetical protein